MQLLVVTDKSGRIHSLAVCRVIFNDDPSTEHPITIRATKQGTSANGRAIAAVEDGEFKSVYVDAPADFAGKSHAELTKRLREIHATMAIEHIGGVAALKTVGERVKPRA